jgi:hypothetical protein
MGFCSECQIMSAIRAQALFATRIAYILLGLILSSCSDVCDNDDAVEYPCSDRSVKAVVFRRSCGATTDFSTHVVLLPFGQQLGNNPGNVLILKRECRIQARWENTKHLVLQADIPDTDVFLKVVSYRGITISYEPAAAQKSVQ